MQQLTKKIILKAAGFSAVAFDVFGTLLNRDVQKPTDLFALMEESGMVDTGFCSRRVTAETKARSRTDGEVTLAQIYAQEPLAGVSEEAECRAELAATVANSAVFEAALACHRRGQKVIAISDMYLPKKQIERMLLKCGYDFLDGIYVSSEYGVQKRSGRLFRLVLTETGMRFNEVIFVGDDLRADVCGASLAGIRSYQLPLVQHAQYLQPGSTTKDGALYAFVNNRLREIPPVQQIGYEVLGPLAVAFAQWVHMCGTDKAETIEKRQRMVWLARDMFSMRKVYQLLYPSADPGVYLKASRKSLIPSLLQLPMNNNNLELLADALPREILSVQQVLSYCDYAETRIADYSPRTTVDLQTRPLTERTKSFLRAMVATGKTEHGNSAFDEGKMVKDYLCQEGIISDGLMLMDIGSGGTTQRLLEKLCNVSMQGHYLACDERLCRHFDNQRAKAFLFDGEAAPVLYWAGQQMLEKLISEPCGATIGYRREKAQILPITEDASAEDERSQRILGEVQKGALRFAQDWTSSFCSHFVITPKQAIAPFMELLNRPSLAHARLLGALTVEDGAIYPLAKPKPKKYYLAHPKKLASDFAQSRWKVGFLKCLFHVSLPYGKLYTELKSKQGK